MSRIALPTSLTSRGVPISTSGHRLRSAPLVRLSNAGVADALDQRRPAGSQFPSPGNRVRLSWQYRAGPLRVRSPHSVIPFRPSLYEKAIISHVTVLTCVLTPQYMGYRRHRNTKYAP